MGSRIIVTTSDYNRLMGLIEFGGLQAKIPNIIDSLHKNLSAARMLPAEEVDKEVVTMNSQVRVKDLKSKRIAEFSITYPHDADCADRKISVFSEPGIALLGRKEKEIVKWKIPSGIGTFEIVKITYQPEAAGHFFL